MRRTTVLKQQGGHHSARAPDGAGDLAVGERSEGPVFLTFDGQGLDRHGVARVVRRVARRAGITKPVGPHTLRHAFITAASMPGCRFGMCRKPPRTPIRARRCAPGRARGSLDWHATYIVAAYLAGAAR